jgi:arylsulfatase
MNDLAAKYPDKVEELTKVFEEEAWKYNVYPLKRNWVNKNPLIIKYSKDLKPQQRTRSKLK